MDWEDGNWIHPVSPIQAIPFRQPRWKAWYVINDLNFVANVSILGLRKNVLIITYYLLLTGQFLLPLSQEIYVSLSSVDASQNYIDENYYCKQHVRG